MPTPTVQVNLRLRPELQERVAQLASARRMSATKWMVEAIEAAADAEQADGDAEQSVFAATSPPRVHFVPEQWQETGYSA